MNVLVTIGGYAALVAAGAVFCYLLLWWKGRSLGKIKALEAEAILSKARAEAEVTVHDARLAASQGALKAHEDLEQSLATRRAERLELEHRLAERESLINSQLQRLIEVENNLKQEKALLRNHTEAVENLGRQATEALQRANEQLQQQAGLGQAEARELFLKSVEQEALRDANNLTRHILDDAKAKAEEKARRIISTAIQRYAGEHTFQNTTAMIAIQGDDIKGRIIGREGRNIRAFEAATGVTVLIDDTPGSILLSAFDPVRREIAREAMARLIQDGRIHPTRIEEVVGQVGREMDDTLVRLGEQAVMKAGLPPMAAEIVQLLGRLHFRSSFSQNLLDHSIEVAHLMALMASELGLEVASAKRAGLLHDIGKAVNHETEGPHAIIGAELLRRCGESDGVVNAVASHHNDVAPIGPLGILVSAADAISASRPGARCENMTTYLKRMEDLEKIAAAFPGVEKAFAVQAGRELRVFVHPEQVDDEAAFALARKLASRIETELQYPGQIRITVIREKRCVEVAK